MLWCPTNIISMKNSMYIDVKIIISFSFFQKIPLSQLFVVCCCLLLFYFEITNIGEINCLIRNAANPRREEKQEDLNIIHGEMSGQDNELCCWRPNPDWWWRRRSLSNINEFWRRLDSNSWRFPSTVSSFIDVVVVPSGIETTTKIFGAGSSLIEDAECLKVNKSPTEWFTELFIRRRMIKSGSERLLLAAVGSPFAAILSRSWNPPPKWTAAAAAAKGRWCAPSTK